MNSIRNIKKKDGKVSIRGKSSGSISAIKQKDKSDGIDAKVYSEEGKDNGKVTLPHQFFGVNWNKNLVHQVIVSMQANKRQMVAHTKDRGDVAGGGAKPWKQKGTGRARHGSSRSPIWIGGGVTHGPRNDKSYFKKINKKMKRKALTTILSKKLSDGELLFIDKMDFTKPKTKKAVSILNNLSKIKGYESLNFKKGNRALITTHIKNDNLLRSFQNIKTVSIDEMRNINPLLLVNYKYLVITNPKESLEILMGNKK